MIIKSWLCRNKDGKYVICPGKSRPSFSYWGDWEQYLSGGGGDTYQINICFDGFEQVFPNLKLKKGEGPKRIILYANRKLHNKTFIYKISNGMYAIRHKEKIIYVKSSSFNNKFLNLKLIINSKPLGITFKGIFCDQFKIGDRVNWTFGYETFTGTVIGTTNYKFRIKFDTLKTSKTLPPTVLTKVKHSD